MIANSIAMNLCFIMLTNNGENKGNGNLVVQQFHIQTAKIAEESSVVVVVFLTGKFSSLPYWFVQL